MNYDKANELARAMRESQEYKELMDAQSRVEKDETATGIVRSFAAKQMELEYARMAQSPKVDEITKEVEKLMPLVQANEAARDYIQAQARWGQIYQDISRIISQPITEGMKVLNHESKTPKH